MSFVELAKSISAAATNGPSNVPEEERKQLLQACSKLQSALETPFEFTLRVIFSVLNLLRPAKCSEKRILMLV